MHDRVRYRLLPLLLFALTAALLVAATAGRSRSTCSAPAAPALLSDEYGGNDSEVDYWDSPKSAAELVAEADVAVNGRVGPLV